MSVEVIGLTEIRSRLSGVARRMVNPELALLPEMVTLEEEERAIFAHWGGKYVDTGRAKRSLTDAGGPDAVRLIHGSELIFGTGVEYVRYLTEEREGRHHRGRNAVMLSPFEVQRGGIGQRILRRILGE